MKQQEIIRALEDVTPFSTLSDEDRKTLWSQFERKVYAKGAFLAKQREPVKRVGFIYAGTASVELKDARGKDLRLGYFQDFDIFGESVLVCGGKSPMSAVCTEPCLCYVQKPERFLETAKAHFDVREYYLSSALQRLTQINLCLCGDKQLSLQVQNGRRPRIIRGAVEYIESFFAHPLDLDEVATAAGVSRFHLSHLFKEKTGFSFRQYLNFVRVQEAKRMLRDEDTPISDIYQAVGFTSSSYFSKIFGQMENATPTGYRLAARTALFDEVTQAAARTRPDPPEWQIANPWHRHRPAFQDADNTLDPGA